jgi:hypothetical protein
MNAAAKTQPKTEETVLGAFSEVSTFATWPKNDQKNSTQVVCASLYGNTQFPPPAVCTQYVTKMPQTYWFRWFNAKCN